MNFIEIFKNKAKEDTKKIILPEGNDNRILKAANIILKEGLAKIVLLDYDDSILKRSKELNLDLSSAQIINPNKYSSKRELTLKLYEIRKHKITLEDADELIKKPNYFACMLLHEGLVDGIVSGANHKTSETIKPALEIIKTKKHVTTASSFFLMLTEDKKIFLFADCAFVVKPTAEELATIAVSTAESAETFGIKPKIGMLSYSTKSSGQGEDVDKVRKATLIARDRRSDLKIDGEIQVDAAIVPEVCKKKCKTCFLKGDANILIFPDLNSGNIGYKLVQRFSKTQAIGPIIQGLKKPVNDLSRGCSVEDVVDLVTLTVIEGQKNEYYGY